jgi:hypothetical protein
MDMAYSLYIVNGTAWVITYVFQARAIFSLRLVTCFVGESAQAALNACAMVTFMTIDSYHAIDAEGYFFFAVFTF